MMHAAPWACQPGNLLRMKIFCRCSTHGAITTDAAGNATADGLRWGRGDGRIMTTVETETVTKVEATAKATMSGTMTLAESGRTFEPIVVTKVTIVAILNAAKTSRNLQTAFTEAGE